MDADKTLFSSVFHLHSSTNICGFFYLVVHLSPGYQLYFATVMCTNRDKTGKIQSVISSFLWILLACALYGALHSLLAGHRAKEFARRQFGPADARYYRLFFSLQGAVTVLPIFILAWRLPDAEIYRIPTPWSLFTLLLQILALVGLYVGVSQTGALKFLGLDALFPSTNTGSVQLVTGGLYRWVRHPLYTCSLLLLWLVPTMTWNLLALAIGLTVYILIGIIFEESKLLREFGPAYAEYRRRTPGLIPFLKI